MSSDDEKVLDEERTEIAEEGEFQSIQTIEKDEGQVEITKIPVCDHCGKKLGDDFSICQKCKRKLCERCSVNFRNRIICPQDLRSFYPLERSSFKILLLVANSIDNEKVIHQLTGISRKEVKGTLKFLVEAGYVDHHMFWKYCVSEMGLEAIHAYGQLYGEATDMIQLDFEVKRYVIQRS